MLSETFKNSKFVHPGIVREELTRGREMGKEGQKALVEKVIKSKSFLTLQLRDETRTII